ncbi:hypothetical protein LSI54_03645 [Nesterenkonia sp. AY15]|uniref:hypothetical protein n=1 Tax=Nesterenkonia sp. AY15 TaxID=2901139 RepID=UPI001F4C8A3B|nr:hypothetical protein [Nesterenkonia sp. AY15]MCH8570458.1 hypothetical protein [Nesterenkonia sp. AY15]
MSEHHDDADPRLTPAGRLQASSIAEPESDPASKQGPARRSGPTSQRGAELLGAALADELSAAEQQELDAMCAQDPQLAEELSALREFRTALRRGLGSRHEEAPPVPPGSLEPLRFSDRGIEVDGVLIARDRGTEAVVEIDGLTGEGSFTVALVAADGQEIESASFLGTEVPLECRMGWAVLREDVERLEIRDDAGVAVLAAELPDVP